MLRLQNISRVAFAAVYILHCCVCLSYTPYGAHRSIDDLMADALQRREQILQAGFDLSSELMSKLIGDIKQLMKSELGQINDGILDNRINELTRDYINDLWTVVDTTKKSLDTKLNDAERRIESDLRGNTKLTSLVESAFKEMRSINWRWQERTATLLQTRNRQVQKIVDGMVQNVVHENRLGNRGDVKRALRKGKDALVAIANETSSTVLADAAIGDARRHELAEIVIAAGHEAEEKTLIQI